MVRTENDGNVRSFAMTSHDFDQIQLRSNMRYDILFEEKGILGPCILRELSYFDVGRGFMADSLHNVYIGSFVCRLS
jgi:hypothetical protein